MRFARMKIVLAMFLTVSVVADNTGCEPEEESLLAFPVAFDACAKYCSCNESDFWCIEGCIKHYRYSVVYGAYNFPGSYIKCLSDTQGCGGVAGCVECDGHVSYCEGNTAVNCMYGKLERQDCAKEGKRCQMDDWNAYCESTEECGSDDSWCEGSVAVECNDGKLYREDCRDSLLDDPTCVLGYEGYAVCASKPLTPCAEYDFSEHCEGNQLVYCNGFVNRYSCSKTGWDAQCTVTSEHANCRIPNTVACGGADSRCDGNMAYMCVEGALMVFNCAQLGKTCENYYGDVICN